ncbi:MAG: hypothetical protein KGH75_09820, partial [Rhodospirillales bacterium]|nr:hypothetical protein [Rhodospirillales bacterium]
MIRLNRNFVVSSTDQGPSLVSNLTPGAQRQMTIAANLRQHKVQAWDQTQTGGSRTTVGQTQTSSNVARATLENIFVEDPRIKRKIFRDMYYHDPVCGGAVDVYANIPFSEFHLTGIKDSRVLDKFHESLECLHLAALLPGISIDHLTLGAFIGNAIFDGQEKIFTSIMPQNIDNCLTGDTKVLTDKGWKTIFELSGPKDKNNLSVTYMIEGKPYKGTNSYLTGHQPCYKVDFTNGLCLRGTKEHRILVYRKKRPSDTSAKLRKWVEIGNLKIGDKVVLNTTPVPKIDKGIEFYEGFFLGALMGDGGKGNAIDITLYGEKRNADFIDCLKLAGVIKTIKVGKKSTHITFNYRAHELIAKSKYQHKVSCTPTSLEQWHGYLSGLTATDGQGGATIHMWGRKTFMTEIMDFLLANGYPHSVLELKAKKGSKSNLGIYRHDMYELRVGPTSARRLAPNMFFRKKHKKSVDKFLAKKTKYENKLAYTKIKSIHNIKSQPVYDITVPGQKRFVANGIIAHNSEIVNIPLFGVDPIVDLIMPKDLSKIMQSKDPRVAQVLSHIPQEFIERIKAGRIPLDPANTIYIPRRTMTAEPYGVSFFERVLPVHLIEKALMRGTIDVSNRRQRSLLHVMVGGDDDWIPTQSDLESFRDLFLQGDMDPTGAIIVTRTGVNTNEIRPATEFWNVDQTFEYASAMKYRAFGLSEGILTGEVSLSTLDASLSVMLDNFRTFRRKITTALFYEKLFPAISAANDFTTAKGYQVTGKDEEEFQPINYRSLYNEVIPHYRNKVIAGEPINTKDLLIPKITYHKHLS